MGFGWENHQRDDSEAKFKGRAEVSIEWVVWPVHSTRQKILKTLEGI